MLGLGTLVRRRRLRPLRRLTPVRLRPIVGLRCGRMIGLGLSFRLRPCPLNNPLDETGQLLAGDRPDLERGAGVVGDYVGRAAAVQDDADRIAQMMQLGLSPGGTATRELPIS